MTKIAIDSGHGSETAGKRTPDGEREHWINTRCAYYCEQYLQAYGIETVRVAWDDLNYKDDPDIAVSTRQKIVKNAKCDYSISFHANAYGSGWNNVSGIEVLYHSTESYRKDSVNLAKKIEARLKQGTAQTDRGCKAQTLAMCNCNVMGTKASVLVEIGFMTNKKEADLMKTDAFCKEQGEDCAKGFLDYLGISEKAEVNTNSEFRVKCLDNLNIRNAPNGQIVKIDGCKKGNIYTIISKNGNWGKLKSGAGWICISAKYVTVL